MSDEDATTFETEVLEIVPEAPAADVIARAAEVLRAGGVVAIPTETVYGLAACALDAGAVGKIFEAKGRPADNPLIVHVADATQAREVVRDWPDAARALADRFWPGPLTLVLPRRPEVPDIVTAGLETVAVRAPAHPVARALIRAVGPLAAPSANASNRVSPTTAAHVVASLGRRIPLVLDGGATEVGIESTVLSLAQDPPVLLRPGGVRQSAISAVIGQVEVAGAADASGPRASPGRMARHYSPRAEVVMVPRGDGAALAAVLDANARSGAIVHAISELPADATAVRLPDDPDGYARGLYAALHHLDAHCDHIVIEEVPDDDAWRAVGDRLSRAKHR